MKAPVLWTLRIEYRERNYLDLKIESNCKRGHDIIIAIYGKASRNNENEKFNCE